MKKILGLFAIVFLVSCGPQMKKRYTFEVTYTNDKVDTLTYSGIGEHLFVLEHGDIKEVGRGSGNVKSLISGVRAYRVLSIQKLGLQNKKEMQQTGCSCDLKLEPKPKKEITPEY